MKTEHDWRDVLLKAASIVEQGWCQGALYRTNGVHNTLVVQEDAEQSCAVGAISRALFHLNGDHELLIATHRNLQKHLLFSEIATWNDSPGRTAAEVAEAMRQAATT